MLRHVVVHLQPGQAGDACRSSAIHFATGYGARLSGLFIRRPPPGPYMPIADPLGPTYPSAELLAAYQDEVRTHEERQNEVQDEVTRAFTRACHEAGIPGETHVLTGETREQLHLGTHTADLVIMGRGDHEGSTTSTVDGWLVRRLTRPVMLVGDHPLELSRIAVAYDGSHGAERSLSLAADVAAGWKGHSPWVDLIHAEHDPASPDVDLAPAEHYLDLYGIEHHTRSARGAAADVIVETAERLDADLLVMGAYGHSRLREMLLGSTTQAVVARWKRPLLLWR